MAHTKITKVVHRTSQRLQSINPPMRYQRCVSNEEGVK
jgi:hypothetical protein